MTDFLIGVLEIMKPRNVHFRGLRVSKLVHGFAIRLGNLALQADGSKAKDEKGDGGRLRNNFDAL